MESLNQLLDACTLPEKTQLVEFAKIKNPPTSKKLRLMQLFVNQPGLSDSEYSHKIYKKPECAAYFQLKKRVKDEFEDLFLLLKSPTIKKETQLHIECSELLLKSELILARGIRSEGAKLLERGLKMAIKNGFHDLILTIYSTAMRFGLCEVLNNNDLPELEIAIKSHLQLLVKKNYKKTEDPPQASNQYLKTMICQLNYRRYSFSKLDEINLSIQNKEYNTALKQVTEAESEWEFDDEPKTKTELLLAKLSILLNQGEFSKLLAECTAPLEQANFSPENSLNHSLHHWHALFHLDQLEEASQVLEKKLTKMDPTQNPKWNYLAAYIDFKKLHFKSAMKRIHTCQKGLKNMPNYYLGAKMLELMILFEQNDQDWLEYKIENFRKLIARKKDKTSTRIQYAFRLFYQMHKLQNKPALLDLEKASLLTDLKNEYECLKWSPDTFELIRYDTWILKILKRPHC